MTTAAILCCCTTTWLVTEAACTEASLIVNSNNCKSAALQARLLAVLLILPIRILKPGVHLRHMQSIATQKHLQVSLCRSFTTSQCVVNVKIVQRVEGLLEKSKHSYKGPYTWLPSVGTTKEYNDGTYPDLRLASLTAPRSTLLSRSSDLQSWICMTSSS